MARKHSSVKSPRTKAARGSPLAMPRIGVIGAGYWGQNHVRVLAELGALAAVCDSRREVRESLRKACAGVDTVAAFHEMLGLGLDALVIATPASTHEAIGTAALDAGLHVMIEKPCAQNVKGVEALIAAARGTGRTLMTGHLLLYHPYLQEAKRQLEEGAIGKPLYVYGQRLNLGRVRTDENVVSSLAPHDLSMVHYLFGCQAISAKAAGITAIRKPRDLCDVAFIHVTYKGGLTAHYHFSWLDPFKRRELIVVGDEGMLVFDDMQAEEKLRIYDKGVIPRRAQDFGEFIEAIEVRDRGYRAPQLKMREPLKLLAENFIACVRGVEEPLAGPQSALEVIRALGLAQAALEQ